MCSVGGDLEFVYVCVFGGRREGLKDQRASSLSES